MTLTLDSKMAVALKFMGLTAGRKLVIISREPSMVLTFVSEIMEL
jgi:hypothetical protein